MREEILNLKNEAIARITEVENSSDLESLRVYYLGRNGKINELTKNIKELDNEFRKEVGILINEIKGNIEQTIDEKSNFLNKARNTDRTDYSIPGVKYNIGHIHLISYAIKEISEIFERVGFTRVRYPEVEWDWYAFGSLNFPTDHPARDEWETFFVDIKPHKLYGSMLLTPHTSSGQVREMIRVKKPPIRMINIAKCYRRQSDISHYPMFHQFEGLVIDKHINITHLKGSLDYFAKSFFGTSVKTRIRPYHFQFTEPSFEVDFSCTVCGGIGCKLCKGGWLEIGGAGMVHPKVLKAGNIDPKIFSGFAFGWGVERVLMMKKGLNIPDLRQLYSTDIRYLKQF